jgi:hypothetical protein
MCLFLLKFEKKFINIQKGRPAILFKPYIKLECKTNKLNKRYRHL